MSYTHMGILQRRRLENTHPMRDYVSVGPHLVRARWLLGFGPGNENPGTAGAPCHLLAGNSRGQWRERGCASDFLRSGEVSCYSSIGSIQHIIGPRSTRDFHARTQPLERGEENDMRTSPVRLMERNPPSDKAEGAGGTPLRRWEATVVTASCRDGLARFKRPITSPSRRRPQPYWDRNRTRAPWDDAWATRGCVWVSPRTWLVGSQAGRRLFQVPVISRRGYGTIPTEGGSNRQGVFEFNIYSTFEGMYSSKSHVPESIP